MDDGRSIGTIDKIEKGKAIINYGLFTTTVSLERLEFVKIKKWNYDNTFWWSLCFMPK